MSAAVSHLVGARVQRRADGAKAKVLELDHGGTGLVVELADGGTARWARSSVVVLSAVRRPKGQITIPDRILAAYRQHVEEGKTGRELAEFYGVSPKTVTKWFSMCREAEEDGTIARVG